MIECIALGKDVTLLGGIKGIVRAIRLSPPASSPHIEYLVVWPDGQTIQEKWVDHFICHVSEPKMQIGFSS